MNIFKLYYVGFETDEYNFIFVLYSSVKDWNRRIYESFSLTLIDPIYSSVM
jgi:hypothetical protein